MQLADASGDELGELAAEVEDHDRVGLGRARLPTGDGSAGTIDLRALGRPGIQGDLQVRLDLGVVGGEDAVARVGSLPVDSGAALPGGLPALIHAAPRGRRWLVVRLAQPLASHSDGPVRGSLPGARTARWSAVDSGRESAREDAPGLMHGRLRITPSDHETTRRTARYPAFSRGSVLRLRCREPGVTQGNQGDRPTTYPWITGRLGAAMPIGRAARTEEPSR